MLPLRLGEPMAKSTPFSKSRILSRLSASDKVSGRALLSSYCHHRLQVVSAVYERGDLAQRLSQALRLPLGEERANLAGGPKRAKIGGLVSGRRGRQTSGCSI